MGPSPSPAGACRASPSPSPTSLGTAECQHPQQTRNNLPRHRFALLAGAIRTLHHALQPQSLLQTLKSRPLAGTGPSAAGTEVAVAGPPSLCAPRGSSSTHRARGEHMAELQLRSRPMGRELRFPEGSAGAEPRGALRAGPQSLCRVTREQGPAGKGPPPPGQRQETAPARAATAQWWECLNSHCKKALASP